MKKIIYYQQKLRQEAIKEFGGTKKTAITNGTQEYILESKAQVVHVVLDNELV